MIFTRDALIGLAVLALIIIGIVWYGATHSAPPPAAPTGENPPTGSAISPQHITDSAEFYTVDAQYPGSTALAGLPESADVNAVALMKQWELDTIAEFKKSFTDLGADFEQHLRDMHLKGSLHIEYKTYQSARTVSYVYTVVEDTLGAHPNSFFHTFSLDTTTGQNLGLRNLFPAGTDYLGLLSKISRQELPAEIAARENVPVAQVDMDMLNDGTKPTEDNFANFYLDGTDFVLLFQPYQIGPYVLGSTELRIPFSELAKAAPLPAQ